AGGRDAGERLQATVRAPAAFGPALALESRRLLVPIVAGQPSDNALDVACGLAAERRSQIIALNVIEVPLDLPLSADLPGEEDRSNRELDEAQAIGDSYGVTVVDRVVPRPRVRAGTSAGAPGEGGGEVRERGPGGRLATVGG